MTFYLTLLFLFERVIFQVEYYQHPEIQIKSQRLRSLYYNFVIRLSISLNLLSYNKPLKQLDLL